MCRLLGYWGPPSPLRTWLSAPPHSLVVQSYAPKEMTAGLLNADGFGVAWYGPNDPLPLAYRSLLPIWSDLNLPHLERYVVSSIYLMAVRSATPGQGVHFSNCPPFLGDRLALVHNGFIENFAQTLARPLRDRLNDALYAQIQGTTDSEHLLGLIRQEMHEGHDLPQAIARTLAWVARHPVKAAVNLVVTDGHRLVATRWGWGTAAPSLYVSQTATSLAIASEPLGDDRPWVPIPPGTLWVGPPWHEGPALPQGSP
ncbi:MAG: ergothioneine biosynthesis protein EgtC [Pseudanabaenaceae cyanobacterium]